MIMGVDKWAWMKGYGVKTTYYHMQDNALGSVDMFAPEGFPAAYISRVRVQPRLRGQGVATKLMREVCEDADKEGVVLVLDVLPEDESISYDRLVDFYSRFGFILIVGCTMARGRGTDYDIESLSKMLGLKVK